DTTPVSNNSWRVETTPYLQRLGTIISVAPEVEGALKKYWPGYFWIDDQVLPPAANVAGRLGIYAVNTLTLGTRVLVIVLQQWIEGTFFLVPLNARFAFECWGGIHFARLTLMRLIKEGNIEREDERARRLSLGSRIEVSLPWGGVSEEKSYNVLDWIDSLKDTCKDARELYDFLSEASHPNFLQNGYFQLASPPLSNWRNEKFKKHGHQLLQKTATAIEAASKGMQSDVLWILEEGTKYIQEACCNGVT
ncbi:MAG: hypothetical protein MN733_37865, partial [Nitrososphaera sp.]|nr:hypothetical protein [Nitrososphaera sp.]